MKQLRNFREKVGYTQQQLAEMLRTTQQTIARWESGKSEPNLAALRDLAVIFRTSVDDLLGHNPLSDSPVTTSMWSLDEGGDAHFWGHLGIQVPGDKVSRWYPVTLREANALGRAIQQASAAEPWVSISTLNNRMLLINTFSVKSIALLDDNAGPIDDDWEHGWDGDTGHSMEVYRALADWGTGGDIEGSDTFTEGLLSLIEEQGFTPELVQERILDTVVYNKDGSMSRYDVAEERLWALVSELDFHQPGIFNLSNRDHGYDRHVPAGSVHLIDMPLHLVIDAAKAEIGERQDEEKAELPSVAKGKSGLEPKSS